MGSIIAAVSGDRVIKYMTRKNKGVYEPEFRLVFMLPAAIFCGLGMFLFGYTLAIGSPAPLCAFLQGVMNVGILIGIFATLTYGLDSFRKQSNEIFVMNMFFKVNIFNSHRIACLTDTHLEFHVLRPLELRQQLGSRAWA